jgi:hypothetical protein
MDDKIKRHNILNSCNTCTNFEMGIKMLNWSAVAGISSTIICLIGREPSKLSKFSSFTAFGCLVAVATMNRMYEYHKIE